MAGTQHTVEFKDKKRKKGYKEKKRAKKVAQYDSGSEEEERTKLQKLHIADSKDGTDEKMSEVYEGANFEKEESSNDEKSQPEEEADDEGDKKEAPTKRKSDTKKKGDGKSKEAAFSDAMNQILNADVDEKTPVILSKNKVLTKILERQKTREEAKKTETAEKKIISNQYHVKPDIATNKDQETKLRKIATKGVIQLFTAVSTAQASESKEKLAVAKRTIVVDGKQTQVSEIEADAFVNLLKEKGSQEARNSKEKGTPASTTSTKVPMRKPVKKIVKVKKEIKQEIKEEEYEDE